MPTQLATAPADTALRMAVAELEGLLFVDKPQGITSHDVVSVVRRAARSKRVGHAGTLDPFATGLLVLAIGRATRLLRYIDGEPKVYDARIVFGTETDTDDATGTSIRAASLPELAGPSFDDALRSLTGELAQVPPAYSAKHVDGTRAYTLARRGQAVALPPVDVVVHRWELLARDGDALDVRITCSGGTYIRALARDLGRVLGSAAHCSTLRRIASGPAHVAQAHALASLTPGSIADGRVALENPLRALVPMTHVLLDDEGVARLRQGRAIALADAAATAHRLAVFVGADKRVLGIGEAHDDPTRGTMWQPRVVLETSA